MKTCRVLLLALPVTLLAACGEQPDPTRDDGAQPARRGDAELPMMPGTAPDVVRQVPEQHRWRLQWLAGQAVPDAGRAPTLQLDAASGRASGVAGVNRFSGPYDLGAGHLSFGALETTRMAGPAELMALERAYLEALAAVDSWRRVDGRLELLDDSDEPLLHLVADDD